MSKSATVTTDGAKAARSYQVLVHCDREGLSDPQVAVFEIDEAKAREIVRLAELVHVNQLLDCRKWDAAVTWHEADWDSENSSEEETDVPPPGEEVRTECDVLVVSVDDFQFAAYVKHGGRIECEAQQIAELADHFGIAWIIPGLRAAA